MTRRKSNNELSVGTAAHPASKNSECKNSLENFSPRFLGMKTSFSSLIILQKTKLSTRNNTHLCWFNWRTFLRKNAAVISPRRSCSCTTMPRLTGHLQPRRNWTNLPSNILIYNPNHRIWNCQSTTCYLDWKKKLKSFQFSSDAEVIAAAETWLNGQPNDFFFFEWFAKLEQGAKTCIELRGSTLNKS